MKSEKKINLNHCVMEERYRITKESSPKLSKTYLVEKEHKMVEIERRERLREMRQWGRIY